MDNFTRAESPKAGESITTTEPASATMTERIAAYVCQRMPEARDLSVGGLHRIPGGASRETWSFDAEWEEHGGRHRQGLILRRDPEAGLLESDRDVEYRVYRAFEGTQIPVPHVFWLESGSEALDRPFFIMERIDGCDTDGNALAARPDDASRQRIARRKFEILGAIHAADPESLGLLDVQPDGPPAPNRCAERELGHWQRIIDAQSSEPLPVIRLAIAWLRNRPPPAAQRVTVCHGDYRSGNFMYGDDDIRGVLDWEMVHLGDPIEDLAWTFLKNWRFGVRPADAGRTDTPIGGICPREQAIAIYEAASGILVDERALRWWEVFSHVKAVGIWITGGRSFTDGRTNSPLMALIPRLLNSTQYEAILDLIGW